MEGLQTGIYPENFYFLIRNKNYFICRAPVVQQFYMASNCCTTILYGEQLLCKNFIWQATVARLIIFFYKISLEPLPDNKYLILNMKIYIRLQVSTLYSTTIK